MSKSLFKKRFSVKDRGSNETLGKIEADFKMHLTHTFKKCPGQLGPTADCVPLKG